MDWNGNAGMAMPAEESATVVEKRTMTLGKMKILAIRFAEICANLITKVLGERPVRFISAGTKRQGSQGRTFVVAMDGDDRFGNGTFVYPWKTMQNVFEEVQAGEPIYVGPGAYTENGVDTDTSSSDFLEKGLNHD